MKIPRTDTIVALVKQCIDEGWDTSDTRPILADAMEEAGYRDESPYYRLLDKLRSPVRVTIDRSQFMDLLCPVQIEGGQWSDAFAYAGEPGGYGKPNLKAAHPGKEVDLSPFARWDVAEVLACSEGENDGPNWLCFGRLGDGTGRYFFLSAGCDYTGWDCQASGDVNIGMTADEVIVFGMGPDDRRRLGIPPIPGDPQAGSES